MYDTDQPQIYDRRQREIALNLSQNVAQYSKSRTHRIIERHSSFINQNNFEPILEYAKEPLLPLSKACAPLANLIPNLMIYVDIALDKTPEYPPDQLTVDESASIRLYSMEWEQANQSLYFVLNQTLKSNDRQLLKPFHKYLKLFLTALVKLPCAPPLTIWRGVNNDISQEFHPGRSLIWWSFMSCTTELTVLENNIYLGKNGNRTLFSIESINCRTIRDHSEYKTEDEVLLLPGSQLIVQSQFMPADDLHVIHLKQIRPEDTLLEVPFEGGHLYPKAKREWYKKKRLVIPMCMLIVLCIVGIIVGSILGTRFSNDEIIDRTIKWDDKNWAYSCDFNFNSILNLSTSSRGCGPACNNNLMCTHFTWIDVNDGTCFLRSGNISKDDAFFVNDRTRVCGVAYFDDYITINKSITWNNDNQANSCDFKGNNLSNVLSISTDCSKICSKTKECTHFMWFKYDGGTCYLKKGNVTKEDAMSTNDPNMICGLM